MPVNPFLSAVNAGEFSPKMDARIDFGKYPNGARFLKNARLLPQGGWYRRAGTKYTASTKSDAEARLFPFIPSNETATMVEAGANYFRFCRRQAQVTVATTDAAVSNGAFTSNITGWDDRSTGSAAIAHDATNGRLQLTGSAGDTAWAEQDITTTATSTVHVVCFKVEGAVGATVKFQIGSASTGSQYAFENGLNVLELGLGWHCIAFTPTSSPFYIQFKNDVLFEDAAENVYIDDVSILSNTPLELPHPYSLAEVRDLKTRSANDVKDFFHGSHPPYKLERRGANTWSFVKTYFEDGPWLSVNPEADLVDEQFIPDPQLTAGISDWENVSTGAGVIEWDGAQTIASIYSAESGGNGILRIDLSTGFRGGTSTKYLLHYNIIGSGTTSRLVYNVTGASNILATAGKVQGWHTEEFTTDAATIRIQFNASNERTRGGFSSCFLYAADVNLLDVSGTTGSITVTAQGGHTPFKSTDVGRAIRFEYPGKVPGWGVITAYTSSTVVTLQVRREIPVDASTESWRLGAWSDTTGWPTSATFYEGRSAIDGGASALNTPYFSQSGDIENFRPDSFVDGATTTEDDDGLALSLDSTTQNGIKWMSGLSSLLIGTGGGLWSVTSDGPVITATDRRAVQQETTTISDLEPVEVGSALVFAGQSKTRIFDLGFQQETQSYVTADLTILADHVLRNTRVQSLAFAQYPQPVIYMKRDHVDRADGMLWTLSYNRREDIIGWSRDVFGGTFSGGLYGNPIVESVAVIPGYDDSSQDYDSGERSEVWLIIKRTIDGNTVRYIEFIEADHEAPELELYDNEDDWIDAIQEGQKDAFYVDSGITYSGAAATTITGLDHLEGQAVAVLADGKIVTSKTVSSGQITLDDAASTVHVGLAYESYYESLKLPYGGRSGPAIMMKKTVGFVGLSLLSAGPFDVGMVGYDFNEDGSVKKIETTEEFKWFRTGATNGHMLTLYSGEKVFATESSYMRDPRVTVKTSSPLPLIVTSVAPTIELQEAKSTS